MGKFLLIGGMGLFLAHTACAWRPSGWVYHQWPWAYESVSGEWYSIQPDGAQWVYTFPPAVGWQVLGSSSLAHGWSYYMWPFVFCSGDGAWYFLGSCEKTWCYSFGNDFWSLLGQVVPQAGSYFSSIERYFSVSRNDLVTMIASFCPQNYTGYNMPVVNGHFHFQHGIVEGNRNSDTPALYPTDGFVMDGFFPSPTQAVGQVSFVYDGHITSTTDFVMSYNPSDVIPVY